MPSANTFIADSIVIVVVERVAEIARYLVAVVERLFVRPKIPKRTVGVRHPIVMDRVPMS